MDVREMARKGGRSKSPKKRAAARKNGRRGGRPSKAEKFAREVRATCERIGPELPDVDPVDLRRIVRCLLLPSLERVVFLHRRKDGRYVF